MRRKLIAGNWKMNGTAACEVLLSPPATLISRLSDVARSSELLAGGQDFHAKPSAAHTGDVSAAMPTDAGASHVILAHSERRADHGETDAAVRAKAEAARAAGLIVMIRIGETERNAGRGNRHHRNPVRRIRPGRGDRSRYGDRL